MTSTAASVDRIVTLDIIRGVAVMGILAANIAAFALPAPSYFSPLAWGGDGPADIAVWSATFILIEGKMRGLFSFLFGASMLLVIDRTNQSGQSSVRIHYARMAVLFAIGIAHMYLVWWGDILAHYALVGAIAFLFRRQDTANLVVAAAMALVASLMMNLMGWEALLASAARDTPAAVRTWQEFAWGFGVPPRQWLTSEMTAVRGPWMGAVAWRWEHLESPFRLLIAIGPETLSAMLFGMAGLRSGFLTGGWPRECYRRWALLCLGVALPAYAAIGLNTVAHGFAMPWVYFGSVVASVPFRTLGFIGYAALIMLAFEPGHWLSARVAAAGRAAFTNYLGTSLLMTAIFYGWGLGLFGTLSRAGIYLFVPPAILLMLLWSKPWLDRYRYGPFEWLWRTLSRGRLQPMRKRTAKARFT